MTINEINAVVSIFADAAKYSHYGSTKRARNEYTPRAPRAEKNEFYHVTRELIGEYDLVKLHIGQFVLDVDAGSFNKDRTEFKPAALAYIRDLAKMKRIVSIPVRIALEEGYKERFSIHNN